MSALRRSLLLCIGLVCACESESKPAPDKKTEEANAEEKQADAKQADAKKDDAKKDGAKKSFDITVDKSGILARSAAALDVEESVDTSEALHDLSHHAEKLPSAQKLCKKMKELGTVEDEKKCATQAEHKVVLIGPEVYAQWADCIMESETAEHVGACDEAEAEAEKALHAKPHGDGLSKEDCGMLFDTFEKLAMADAGDQAPIVKEVLEEVEEDVITSCMDQGTKDELECAKKSKTLQELDECASAHI